MPEPASIVVELRPAAVEDLDRAVSWYLREAGADVAGQFLDGVETVMDHLRRFPEFGSPRWGAALDYPGLRAVAVEGFPHVVFHVRSELRVDVLRVLHERRDVPQEFVDDQ